MFVVTESMCFGSMSGLNSFYKWSASSVHEGFVCGYLKGVVCSVRSEQRVLCSMSGLSSLRSGQHCQYMKDLFVATDSMWLVLCQV